MQFGVRASALPKPYKAFLFHFLLTGEMIFTTRQGLLTATESEG